MRLPCGEQMTGRTSGTSPKPRSRRAALKCLANERIVRRLSVGKAAFANGPNARTAGNVSGGCSGADDHGVM